MLAYKIVECRAGRPITLFHGVGGNRVLTPGMWLQADLKMVNNGSRTNPYKSGFHAYPAPCDVYAWLKNATNIEGRYVVRVEIEEWWEKPDAVRLTYLAEWMMIDRDAWAMRVPAETFIEHWEAEL